MENTTVDSKELAKAILQKMAEYKAKREQEKNKDKKAERDLRLLEILN